MLTMRVLFDIIIKSLTSDTLIGISPNGKATDSDSVISRFESLYPCYKGFEEKSSKPFFILKCIKLVTFPGFIVSNKCKTKTHGKMNLKEVLKYGGNGRDK